MSDLLNVAWLSPDLYPDTADDGEYRIVKEDGSFGRLAIWVDDAPDDPSDGAGHFQEFADEPENYYYNSRRQAAAEAAGAPADTEDDA